MMAHVRTASVGAVIRLSQLGWLLPVLSAGCATQHADVSLFQPRQDGAQQIVELSSSWAYYTDVDPDVGRLLLEWPLPGSQFGQKHYSVYLRIPLRDGAYEIGQAFGPEDKLREIVGGFLIQRSGRLKGLTRFVMGGISIQRNPMPSGHLELKCADGTEIRGDFTADAAGYAVAFFERDHQSDVANLREPAAPALAGADHVERK